MPKPTLRELEKAITKARYGKATAPVVDGYDGNYRKSKQPP